jgi:hypothetical protein
VCRTRRISPLTDTQLWTEPHVIFGTVIVCLMGIQPIFGILHHRHFVKARRRGAISYVHIWWGRVLMALGVINGGVGLKLVEEDNGPIIAYGVISGVIFLGYIGYKTCRFFHHGTDTRGAKEGNQSGGHSA